MTSPKPRRVLQWKCGYQSSASILRIFIDSNQNSKINQYTLIQGEWQAQSLINFSYFGSIVGVGTGNSLLSQVRGVEGMEKQQQQLKTLNVRTEKWREMLKENPFKDPALVRKRVRKGIPPMMRQKAWPRLVDLKKFSTESKQSYEALIKQKSSIEGEIRLDIPRTFTEEKAELMRTSLFNVLKALSLVYPELGYCQGMNQLSMKLLETLTDETCFWLMNYSIRTCRNILWVYKNPSSTELQNHVLQQLMYKYSPAMMNFLKSENVKLEIFTPKWFITLFSSTLPTELFYRVYECFLCEGYKIIYKAALTILKINEPLVMGQPFETILEHLMKNGHYEKIDPDEFCATMQSYTFTNEEINAIEERFISANQSKVVEWQEQAQKSYQKRITSKLLSMDEVEDERLGHFLANPSVFKKAPFELYKLK